MPWWVREQDDPEESLGKFYENEEIAEALAHFFRAVAQQETADLHWSY